MRYFDANKYFCVKMTQERCYLTFEQSNWLYEGAYRRDVGMYPLYLNCQNFIDVRKIVRTSVLALHLPRLFILALHTKP